MRQFGCHARLTALAVAVVLLATLGGCSARPKPELDLASCVVQGHAAKCGTLTVPENRVSGKGRRIGLSVVVVPASAPVPGNDPIVYLAGGPGDAATDHVADLVAIRGASTRDLVFVDQRGTGGSNRLTCPQPGPGVDLTLEPQLTSYVKACLEGLDADPRFYTTEMAADDLAEVLATLGYPRVNLYGGSYGATAAQVFARRHPASVRTMTLIGGTLLDLPIFEWLPRSSQAALDDVMTRCATDLACRRAFPQLRQEWHALLASLAVAPVTVPDSGFTLTTGVLAAAVHNLLLNADDAAQLPELIHAIATAENRSAVVASYARRFPDLLEGPSDLLVMAYVTRCNERWAGFEPAAVIQQGEGSYYLANAVSDARHWQQACQLFRAAGTPADQGAATISTTPVLAINGSADPQDPPANMSGAAKLWPRGRFLVAPHQSHNITEWECQESIIDAFIDRGSVLGLDTGCLAAVPVPAFTGTG